MAEGPKLKPAFTFVLEIDDGIPVGELSHGPDLVWVNIKSGALKSEPGFPIKVDATLISGADWKKADPSGAIQRIDVRSIFKTDDGAILNFSYLGVVHVDQRLTDIFQGKAKPGFATEWTIVTQKSFQTGDERYKKLEDEIFVGVGRALVTDNGVSVEYKISQVVS